MAYTHMLRFLCWGPAGGQQLCCWHKEHHCSPWPQKDKPSSQTCTPAYAQTPQEGKATAPSWGPGRFRPQHGTSHQWLWGDSEQVTRGVSVGCTTCC